MIIQPKVSSPSTLDYIEIMRENSIRQVYVVFQDDLGNPVDIVEEMNQINDPKGSLDLQVTDMDGLVLHTESYFPIDYTDTSRRVVHPATGKYQIKWGTETGESSTIRTLLFNWHLRKDDSSDDYYRTQVVDIISPRTLSLLPVLRLQIDKSLKVIFPENFCNLGYSDSQLVTFLQLGLAYINARQPYASWNLDSFPLDRGLDILIKASLYEGLLSQLIFAIDTDVPAFSDQGHSFVITHASQLKALRDSLTNELDKTVREFKMHYVASGTLGAEIRIGWAFYQTIATAPPGFLFRGGFASSI